MSLTISRQNLQVPLNGNKDQFRALGGSMKCRFSRKKNCCLHLVEYLYYQKEPRDVLLLGPKTSTAVFDSPSLSVFQ